MARLISASIDLTKVDKSKLIEGKKGGKYLNLLISVNDEPDQYKNDVAVSINQSREERERGEKKIYLGNGQTIWSNEVPHPSSQGEPGSNYEPKDDLPF